MSPWKAAQPGDALHAVDTPALVLDLDAFERNLQRMADALRGRNVRLRAHAKSWDLLRRTRRPLKQIAQAVGFRNEKSFARAFRQWTGAPPSALRGA